MQPGESEMAVLVMKDMKSVRSMKKKGNADSMQKTETRIWWRNRYKMTGEVVEEEGGGMRRNREKT